MTVGDLTTFGCRPGIAPVMSDLFICQRMQIPNIYGLWSQIPLKVWFLGAEASNIGYLDPLGLEATQTSDTPVLAMRWFQRKYYPVHVFFPETYINRKSEAFTPFIFKGSRFFHE